MQGGDSKLEALRTVETVDGIEWLRNVHPLRSVEQMAGSGEMTTASASGWRTYTEYLEMHTRKRREMVHITEQVERVVHASKVQDGLCFVSPMHITAAIYVNDNESGLIEDINQWLETLAPARPDYRHHRTGEDNADAHLKSLLLQHETTLPVTGGRLDLGTWQRIFYAEFDGQRRKRVIVKVLGVGS
jgi:secondary thiamine-phosphate synthase enzyme